MHPPANEEPVRRIAIVGAGGVGGYLGALLDGRGAQVSLVDQGAHLEVLRTEGVRVRSRARGELHARLPATDDPGTIGTVDLVLFCVKTYDNAVAIPSLRPLVGRETSILTVQNGVGNLEQLAAAYGGEAVLGGAMVGGGTRVAAGVIEHVLPVEAEYIELGAAERSAAGRVDAVIAALEPAGLAVRAVDDIQATLWTKLLAMASLAAVGCLTRVGTAEWRDHPAARGLYTALVREAAAVARAEEVALDDHTVAEVLEQPDRLGPAHRTSMHADLERGERLEVEAVHGEVVRRAARHGVPTPAFETIYAVLKHADDRARG
jgi:2-dehydropantoate 2-reductase